MMGTSGRQGDGEAGRPSPSPLPPQPEQQVCLLAKKKGDDVDWNAASKVSVTMSDAEPRNPSPDSACESDPLSSDCSSPLLPVTLSDMGSTLVPNIRHRVQTTKDQARESPLLSPPYLPPPPPPPVQPLATSSSLNVPLSWPTLDSDGDSGIINLGDRLGSTSSSETGHSLSGITDPYLSWLHAKHLNKALNQTQRHTVGPIRADHTISLLKNNHCRVNRSLSLFQDVSPSLMDTLSGPPSLPATPSHPTPSGRATPGPEPRAARSASWALHRTVSIPLEAWGSWSDPGPASSSQGTNYRRPPISCTCHQACIHCGSRFGDRWSRKTLESPTSHLGRMSTSNQGKSGLYVNVYENLSGSDDGEDSVFHGNDMIKVHARPASVIPAATPPIVAMTPRQAKSADAAARHRRLHKALSLASALNYDDLISVHASVASVIPSDNGNLIGGGEKPAVPERQRPPAAEHPKPAAATPPPTPPKANIQRSTSLPAPEHMEEYAGYPLPPRPGTALCAPVSQAEVQKRERVIPPPLPKNPPPHPRPSKASAPEKQYHTLQPDKKTSAPSKARLPTGNIYYSTPMLQKHGEATGDFDPYARGKTELTSSAPSSGDEATKKSESASAQSEVAYAKVNKTRKGQKNKTHHHHLPHRKSLDATLDDNEPPLPPRNYRSETEGLKGSRSSLSDRVHGLTRSAKEALRRAFSLNWNKQRPKLSIVEKPKVLPPPPPPPPPPPAVTKSMSARWMRNKNALTVNGTTNYAEI